MFTLKCGNCGSEFSIDEEQMLKAAHGENCPNCNEQIPRELTATAILLANLKGRDDCKNWDLFRTKRQRG